MPSAFIHGYWRYASIGDLLAIVLSVSASTALLTVLLVVATLLQVITGFSRSVLLIDWLLTLALIAGTRLSVRVVGEAWRRGGLRRGDHGAMRRALIVGAGAAGTMVAREMYQNPQLGLSPAGFLTTTPRSEASGSWASGAGTDRRHYSRGGRSRHR